MKKAIGLVIAVAIISFLIFYLKTWSPFFGVIGKSMEPEFKAGDLLFIKSISAPEVKENDIIVFEVPSLVREHYNYPQIVAHRVVEIHQRNEGIVFRTKGDNNAGNDPFVVRPTDLRGAVSKKIPNLGFLLLFLQSKQGLISIAVLFFLMWLGSYNLEIKRLRQKIHKGIFAPVLEKQEEHTEALNGFTSAITEYAKHLESHTKAVQSLSKAAEKLEKVAEKLDDKIK